MPFDATDLALSTSLLDRLTAVGIRPVPSDVVHEHKQHVIRDFSTSMRGRALVRSGAATWRTLHIYRALEILARPRKHTGPTIDISAAPRAIIKLAERVSIEMSDAEFELDWFYTDPVLNVVGSGQRACLGIWDSGRIVAIADHDGFASADFSDAAPRKTFWRRCIGLFRNQAPG